MQEDKRRLVINKISREAINPQSGLPHPAQRIENAVNEAKVKFDPFVSVDQQVQTALKAIKPLIPIRFEKVKVAVRLPGSSAGGAYSAIHHFGEILNEEWQQDGSWIGIVECLVAFKMISPLKWLKFQVVKQKRKNYQIIKLIFNLWDFYDICGK